MERGRGRRWLVAAVAAAELIGTSGPAWADRISVPPGASGWVIESAEYSGDVDDQLARMTATYVIKVFQDGYCEIPLGLTNVRITRVELERRSGQAYIIPRGGGYALRVDRKGTYQVEVAFSHRMPRDVQWEGIQFGIPQATLSSLSLFVPRRDIELRELDRLYVAVESEPRREGVQLEASLASAEAVDIRWRTKPAQPVKIDPVVYGDVYTAVILEEELARVMHILDYRVAQGEVRLFEVILPAGLAVRHVRGAAIEDWRVADTASGGRLTVTLASPVRDDGYRLLIEGEQSTAGAASFTLPELVLDGVKQERGYLALARMGSLEIAPDVMEGATRIDIRELPQVMAGMIDQPVLAYRYHQHPYRVAATLTRHEHHPVLSAVAEQGELITVVSRQGELLSRATYLLRANKKQFLAVRLPEGATLWGALVDGSAVKPAVGEAGALLVPLSTADDPGRPVVVEVVYYERRGTLSGIGRLALEGPELDVPLTIANWTVFAPESVRFMRVKGNVERGATPTEFLAGPFTPAGRRDANAGGVMRMLKRHAQFIGQDELGESGKTDGKMRAAAEAPVVALGYGHLADAPGRGREDREMDLLQSLPATPETTGLLSLMIRLPKSGRAYQFSRLMTAEDALRMDATFVHIAFPWLPVAAAGFLLVPVVGLVGFRLCRSAS
ncbi:MAG TPA: hypothetical protein VGB20_02355 [bacterium]